MLFQFKSSEILTKRVDLNPKVFIGTLLYSVVISPGKTVVTSSASATLLETNFSYFV